MSQGQNLSRRRFVTSAISAAAISCLPKTQEAFAKLTATNGANGAVPQNSSVPLTTTPLWRDQGILNLTKSPYAKLRNVPVNAVKIETGFWSPRREGKVTSSIPSIAKVLEANRRMH